MKTWRVRICGSGGQGVLALGLTLAQAAVGQGLEAAWLPSYGPEQRGGSANCSVVLSEGPIVSPVVGVCDVLVCLNLEGYRRFIDSLVPTGLLFVDEELPVEPREGQVRVPARRQAEAQGMPQAANTVFLAAISRHLPSIGPDAWKGAFAQAFKRRPDLAERNLALFDAARAMM